jgi:signal transduction histidine kinase
MAESHKSPAAAAAPHGAGSRARRNAPERAAWSRREIEALLRVSEAVALESSLGDVLDVIATEACRVTSASSASVVLVQPRGPLRLAASKGLSRDYDRFLRNHFVTYAGTVSRVAVDRLAPVVVNDITTDPLLARQEAAEWKRFAIREGFQSMISAPLVVGRRASGALNLYRAAPGPWPTAEIELAASLAQHAASAIDSTELIQSQNRQVDGLERLLRVLRDQTHEYANRLQDVSGLLAVDQIVGAQRLLAELMTLHHDNYAAVVERVHEPILAGLLLAQMSVARQRGVDVRLHGQTHLVALPRSLGSAEAVTIVANLIDNAVQSVADLPASRRRASVRISQGKDVVRITVRDWGNGIPAGTEKRLFERGCSSKKGHAGIGLALVSEAVASAHGTIALTSMRPGTAFHVTLPSG